ncbi:pentapeptide repeat-containing protein [Rhodococcus aetherivorans]|uniref:pentapeptide repeat-containing protein n=1 Tax=Rhodococcus aetherivorans TaxID=191292 RepID=UPI003689DF30
MQIRRTAAIAAPAFAGITVGFVLGRLISVPGSTQFWDIAAQPAATAFAGFGAITAGFLAFRNGEKGRAQDALHHRKASESERESNLRERYTTAASQLGDENPAIREAGIYAVGALADDWVRFGEQAGQKDLARSELQACVNLLCSYLRANRRISGGEALPDSASERGMAAAPAQIRAEEYDVRRAVVGVIRERSEQWHLHSDGGAALVLDLGGADLDSDDLVGADLSGVILSGANLTQADLAGAKLVKARIDMAELSDVLMHRAKLADADLSLSNLSGALLFDSDLTGAGFVRTNLSNADLRGANLSSALMTEADLTSADLREADLAGADLTRATLDGADLSGANLTGVMLDGANYNDATKWPYDFSPNAGDASEVQGE